MWKVKLDDGVWLAESTTTAIEEKAWLFNDIPSVQAQLKKVRRLAPYPNVMVIAEFNQTYSISEQCTSLSVSDAIDCSLSTQTDLRKSDILAVALLMELYRAV